MRRGREGEGEGEGGAYSFVACHSRLIFDHRMHRFRDGVPLLLTAFIYVDSPPTCGHCFVSSGGRALPLDPSTLSREQQWRGKRGRYT